MEDSHQKPPGLRSLLRRFGSTLLTSLQTRLELFVVELQEERQRFLRVVLWSAAALFFGMVATVLITITVVWACPIQGRIYVLAGFCLLYSGLAFGAGYRLRKRLRNRPPAFSATLGELKKDAAWLRSQS